jgi:hypothetical protein
LGFGLLHIPAVFRGTLIPACGMETHNHMTIDRQRLTFVCNDVITPGSGRFHP